MDNEQVSRRDFLKAAVVAAGGTAMASCGVNEAIDDQSVLATATALENDPEALSALWKEIPSPARDRSVQIIADMVNNQTLELKSVGGSGTIIYDDGKTLKFITAAHVLLENGFSPMDITLRQPQKSPSDQRRWTQTETHISIIDGTELAIVTLDNSMSTDKYEMVNVASQMPIPGETLYIVSFPAIIEAEELDKIEAYPVKTSVVAGTEEEKKKYPGHIFVPRGTVSGASSGAGVFKDQELVAIVIGQGEKNSRVLWIGDLWTHQND